MGEKHPDLQPSGLAFVCFLWGRNKELEKNSEEEQQEETPPHRNTSTEHPETTPYLLAETLRDHSQPSLR